MASPPVAGDSANRADAARYALLRRLAPALRHGMVGALHPIELIVEAIDRRLLAAALDPANVRENLDKIKNLSRSALSACTNVTSWLAPEGDTVTMLGEGIDECLALLKTDFSMRGFAVRNEAQEIDVDVSRAALRQVLTASLIAATDSAPRPAELLLTTELLQGQAVVSLLIRPGDGVAGFGDAAPYRRLEWSDVGALAQAESVDLQRHGDRVTMRFPAAETPQGGPLPS